MLTPQKSYPKLAKALSVPEIILKREDLHPYGSHKGRSIPQMITLYANQGYNNFVISSSGNAALAAINLVREYNFDNPNKQITLKIFVGKNIDKKKLKILKHSILSPYKGEKTRVGASAEEGVLRKGKKTRVGASAEEGVLRKGEKTRVGASAEEGVLRKGEMERGFITIEQVARPKQVTFQLEKNDKIKNLRQSTDNSALEGYKTLAEELNIIENLQAVFVPTSSGTTAEALGKFLPPTVQIHIAQTTACHPIAQEFDKNFVEEKNSLATAIVDKIAHRKEKVLQTIKNSRGSGWIISNDEIKKAMKLVKEKTGIEISPNSALSVAGIIKAVQNGWKLTGAVVCLITGK